MKNKLRTRDNVREPRVRIPDEFQNSITDILVELEERQLKESQRARVQSRIWVPIGSVLAIATPASAFLAGFGGLNELIGPRGVLVGAFLTGFIGAVSLTFNRLSRTEGLVERFRSEALDQLAWQISTTLGEYVLYRQELLKGRPIGDHTTEQDIVQWLCRENVRLAEQASHLRKFVFKADVSQASDSGVVRGSLDGSQKPDYSSTSLQPLRRPAVVTRTDDGASSSA